MLKRQVYNSFFLLLCTIYFLLLTAVPGFCGRVALTTIFVTDPAISSCEELQAMQNVLTANYYLTNDIDCSMTNPELSDGSPNPNFDPFGPWGDRKGFKPVGDWENKFAGSFDGRDYEITDLYMDRPSAEKHIGLFGVSGIGGIKNVGLVNVDITGDNDGGDDNACVVGSLSGCNATGTITNSYATGNVNGNGCLTGGLVGVDYFGRISNSHFIGNVSGSDWYVGGLVAIHSKGSEISNSYSAGSVSGLARIGGLVSSNKGLISGSYSTSSVSGLAIIGGLVGNLSSSSLVSGTIVNSYATGEVSGDFVLGGLVGEYWSTGVITNSYATGEVIGKEYWFGEWFVGGLVGQRILIPGDTVLPVVVDSYWDTQTSGQNNMCGGDDVSDDCGDAYGRTAVQMKQEATYQPEWDFDGDSDPDNIWKINEGVTYPYLN